MNTGGDAADQMVRESIQVTEEAIKLSALGAKNLAAILVAMMKENPKMRGRTNLNRLLKDGKELKVFPLAASDLARFKKEAKHYGVLFTAIRDKSSEGELIDIMARAEDVSKLNRIFERIGYQVPKEKEITRKKEPTRRQPESASTTRGPITRANPERTTERPSVKAALRRLKAIAEKGAHAAARETTEQSKER